MQDRHSMQSPLSKTTCHGPAVADREGVGGAVRQAVAAARARVLGPAHALVRLVDTHVEGRDPGDRALDVRRAAGDVEHEIAVLLGRDLGAEDVHEQVVVLHQVVDDRLLRLALREVEQQLLGDRGGFAHAWCLFVGRGFRSLPSGPRISSPWNLTSVASGRIGFVTVNSPRRISSASRFAASSALA